MKIALVSEVGPAESRVALVPETVRKLVAAEHEVAVEAGAGEAALFLDDAYAEAGAKVVDRKSALADAELVVRVTPPSVDEVAELPEGSSLISFLQPVAVPDSIRALADRRVDAYSLDLLPRTSRAQSMDALSSQATVSGYRGMLIAAQQLPRFFPLLMTAAGTVPPARVLVLGAGVAGLQAISVARRLGAVVSANDIRSAAREEVQSLGATFVELEQEAEEGQGGYARAQSEEFLTAQREFVGRHVADSDVVVTTAAVPGKRAPLLVTREMVEGMRPGSVLVDLAADGGGNCEVTVAGEDVVHGGVHVIGVTNPPSGMPTAASTLYSRNLNALLNLLVREGRFDPDPEDDIVVGCRVTHDGAVVHSAAKEVVA